MMENPNLNGHYRLHAIEPCEVIDDWGLDFYLGNVIKYVARAGHKDGADEKDDLLKALDYLHRAATGAWIGGENERE